MDTFVDKLLKNEGIILISRTHNPEAVKEDGRFIAMGQKDLAFCLHNYLGEHCTFGIIVETWLLNCLEQLSFNLADKLGICR